MRPLSLATAIETSTGSSIDIFVEKLIILILK